MTPERAETVLRATVTSLGAFVAELETLVHKLPEAQHLLATMKQAHASLEMMVERD